MTPLGRTVWPKVNGKVGPGHTVWPEGTSTDDLHLVVVDVVTGDVVGGAADPAEAERIACRVEAVEIAVNGGCLPGRFMVKPESPEEEC